MHQTTLRQMLRVSIFSGSERSKTGQKQGGSCKEESAVRNSSYHPLLGCVAPTVLTRLLWKTQLCSALMCVEGGTQIDDNWEMHICTSPDGNAAPVCWINRSLGTSAFVRVTQIQN